MIQISHDDIKDLFKTGDIITEPNMGTLIDAIPVDADFQNQYPNGKLPTGNMVFKGNLPSDDELPTTANIGDFYFHGSNIAIYNANNSWTETIIPNVDSNYVDYKGIVNSIDDLPSSNNKIGDFYFIGNGTSQTVINGFAVYTSNNWIVLAIPVVNKRFDDIAPENVVFIESAYFGFAFDFAFGTNGLKSSVQNDVLYLQGSIISTKNITGFTDLEGMNLFTLAPSFDSVTNYLKSIITNLNSFAFLGWVETTNVNSSLCNVYLKIGFDDNNNFCFKPYGYIFSSSDIIPDCRFFFNFSIPLKYDF